MKKHFLLCGGIGWCLEILWTGVHALFQKDFTLRGQSSIWMFPIYGCAALIGPVSKKLHQVRISTLGRGSIYTAGIFAAEYSTGMLLKYFHACPWDYSSSPFNYQGVIRLDYAPVWFITGLFFEKILADKS